MEDHGAGARIAERATAEVACIQSVQNEIIYVVAYDVCKRHVWAYQWRVAVQARGAQCCKK